MPLVVAFVIALLPGLALAQPNTTGNQSGNHGSTYAGGSAYSGSYGGGSAYGGSSMPTVTGTSNPAQHQNLGGNYTYGTAPKQTR